MHFSNEDTITKLIAEIISETISDDIPANKMAHNFESTFNTLLKTPDTILPANFFGIDLPDSMLPIKEPTSNLLKTCPEGTSSQSPDTIGCSSTPSTRSCPSSPNSIQTTCDIHKDEVHRYYCETCHVSGCIECAILNHDTHQLLPLEHTIDEAVQKNMHLNAKTRSAIEHLKDALNKTQRITDHIDLRHHEVTMEIKEIMRRCFMAVEKRQKDLIFKLDEICKAKENHLKTQMFNLQLALNRLNTSSALLLHSRESINVLDLIPANKRAQQTLEDLDYIHKELIYPCENDNITFISDQQQIRDIFQFGIINACINPPPIQHFHDSTEICSNMGNMFVMPICRPIYGVKKPIITTRFSKKLPFLAFGKEGNQPGELCRPWGLCCDSEGRIFVADRSNNRIQVFDHRGSYLFHFGSAGSGRGQFDRPTGIAINPVGHVIVTDKDNHRIQVFRADGTFLFMFGEKGSKNGQFHYPWDVACNYHGQMVVSDTRNHRIQLFTADGGFINKFGFENCTGLWKQFDTPRGVCFTPQGAIICTDFNNHRLVFFNKHLRKIRVIGCEGSGNRQFLRPQGIVCDDYGNIIIADSRNNRIQVFDENGDPVSTIGSGGAGIGQFNTPTGVALTPGGHIVVMDFGNTRVQIF